MRLSITKRRREQHRGRASGGMNVAHGNVKITQEASKHGATGGVLFHDTQDCPRTSSVLCHYINSVPVVPNLKLGFLILH